MNQLTTQQYQNSILNNLSYRQIEVLQLIYSLPGSCATTRQLATLLHNSDFPSEYKETETGKYKKYNPIKIIGQIGKVIALSNSINIPKTGKGNRTSKNYSTYIGETKVKVGLVMWDNLKEALENLRLVNNGMSNTEIYEPLPTETFQTDESDFLKEGKVIQVFTNRYERNPKARHECIKYYGCKCTVCDFDFGKFYGELAEGFIHVHHKLGLAEINSEYIVDPINDLIPVCANCHSVIHLTRPAQTLEELKNRINKNRIL